MEFIDGTVENIVYRNEDNGYTVMEIDADGLLELPLVICLWFMRVSMSNWAVHGLSTNHTDLNSR